MSVNHRGWDASTPSPKGIDPPVRLNFINSMPLHRRATALLRLYLEKRCAAKDRDEAKMAKSMLRALNGVQAGDNAMGVELAIMPAKRPCVQIYFNVHGIGPVVWLPVLVLHSNPELEHILRETGPNRVAIDRSVYRPIDPEARPRKGFPHKADAELIPGKKV